MTTKHVINCAPGPRDIVRTRRAYYTFYEPCALLAMLYSWRASATIALNLEAVEGRVRACLLSLSF